MHIIQKEEEKLFSEWKENRERFSEDGIINITRYLESNRKIMFILKETNSKHGKSVPIKEILNNAGNDRKATWDNVARWVYGINHLSEEVQWTKLEDREFLKKIRADYLPSFCLINLKKSSGRNITDQKELKEIAEKDRDFLKRQFNLYYNNVETRPDVIICGGRITFNTGYSHMLKMR